MQATRAFLLFTGSILLMSTIVHALTVVCDEQYIYHTARAVSKCAREVVVSK